jgi:hypothetical protein
MKTITEWSLLLMIPIIPVKKADMPEIPTKIISIANVGISSLLCPYVRSISKANQKAIDPKIPPIDHFPRAVLGSK